MKYMPEQDMAEIVNGMEKHEIYRGMDRTIERVARDIHDKKSNIRFSHRQNLLDRLGSLRLRAIDQVD